MGVVSDLPEPRAGASAARRPVLSRAVDWVTVGLSILAVGACQTARSSPPPAVPSMVLRMPVYLDSAGVADGTGQVRVAVRAAPRPTEGLGDALVTLLDAQQRPVARATSTAAGVAVFPRVPIGRLTLRVQRIGYELLTLSVRVTAGCATDVETYLAMAFIGIEAIVVDTSTRRGQEVAVPAPPLRVTGARATVTMCGEDVPSDR